MRIMGPGPERSGNGPGRSKTSWNGPEPVLTGPQPVTKSWIVWTGHPHTAGYDNANEVLLLLMPAAAEAAPRKAADVAAASR